MRDILLLSYTFPPDNTAAAVRPAQLFDYLPYHRYRPHVIASSFEGGINSDGRISRVPRPREPFGRRLVSTAAQTFTRYLSPYDDRQRWIPYAAATATELIRSEPIEAVVSTSPFLASHFAALWLKRRFGLPWIADFQDPVVDNPMRTRRWFYPYDSILESTIFRHADKLVANTDTVADAWRTRYPQWSDKISVSWNSFDPREEIPLGEPAKHAIPVLAHVGALYGGRNPGALLSALEKVGPDFPRLHVNLVGPIEPALLNSLRPLFERLRTKGILEYGNRLVERTEALRETADADYLLLLDVNEANASFQVPSKLLDYVRYGKPIMAVTPKDSPVERILSGSGVSFVAIDPREDDQSIGRKVREFLGRALEPRPYSAWFYETFNADALAVAFAQQLDQLLAVEPSAPLASKSGRVPGQATTA
jgi:glycosyltransferase involved in cell wall biosynthesis